MSGWKGVLRREWAKRGLGLREGNGRRVDRSVKKENADKWTGEWRRDRAMMGLEWGEEEER